MRRIARSCWRFITKASNLLIFLREILRKRLKGSLLRTWWRCFARCRSQRRILCLKSRKIKRIRRFSRTLKWCSREMISKKRLRSSDRRSQARILRNMRRCMQSFLREAWILRNRRQLFISFSRKTQKFVFLLKLNQFY